MLCGVTDFQLFCNYIIHVKSYLHISILNRLFGSLRLQSDDFKFFRNNVRGFLRIHSSIYFLQDHFEINHYLVGYTQFLVITRLLSIHIPEIVVIFGFVGVKHVKQPYSKNHGWTAF